MNKYDLQKTSIWRFPDRGNWATHNATYRGNWSPHVPKNLILKYSNENDLVLDMFVGSGTTLIETKLLNRKGIGIDINPKAIETTLKNLDFECEYVTNNQKVILGDATNLHIIDSNSIDMICTHPPYSNIIKYSDLSNDLSNLNLNLFLNSMELVAKECYRVLKSNKVCCIMIGDIRKNSLIVPLGSNLIIIFMNLGFKLKEIIIKEQFNCKSTPFWINKNLNFYLLIHEYILVFKK